MYYCGVIHFLEEDYSAAEQHLMSAYNMCHVNARKNIQLILTYLIPTKLLTSHSLPSSALLAQYPSLARLFQPFCDAIRKADLAAFNAALENGEAEFVKRRIYLTLERGRDVILRNIFRKVFIAGGFEAPKEGETAPPARRTRISIDEFAAALQLAGAEVGDGDDGVDFDEVECLIANAIYKVRDANPRSLSSSMDRVAESRLTRNTESHERIYRSRASDHRAQQSRRFPWNGRMRRADMRHDTRYLAMLPLPSCGSQPILSSQRCRFDYLVRDSLRLAPSIG